jgi:Fic-DOC domain mobile mystery protein B
LGRALKLTYPPGATPLDPDEMAGLLPTSIATQGELDAFEQANIADAEGWALRRKHKDVLSEPFVRALHRRMLAQVWRWAGSYRTSDKNIGVPWQQIPTQVRQLCDDASYWVSHPAYGWDELGTRFHHRLVAIHPFPNGNGRHARLMTEVLLRSNGQALFSWGRASVDPTQVRARYIAALRAADGGEYGALIAFVRS